METVAAIGLFILGAAWVVTSLMCIAGVHREWARARPTVFNYLGRNFMPYTFLSVGLMCVGFAPQVIWDDPHFVGNLFTLITVVPALPMALLSMVHWPLFLSPPWYRRWFKRGGRMANNAPLWDPPDARNQPYRGNR